MPSKPIFSTLISLVFISTVLCALAENNSNPPYQAQTIGEELARIKPWHLEQLNSSTHYLAVLAKKNPDSITWLEKNTEISANFHYLLASLTAQKYWPNDKRIDYDKIQNHLQAAAQQEHASALYLLGKLAWDNQQAFDYLSRSFYAGYYWVLGDLSILFADSQPDAIKTMKRHAEKLSEGDFEQFYQLSEVYLYYFNDGKSAKHYLTLAEQQANPADLYRLAYLYRKLYQQKTCSDKEIAYYQQSMLAGNARALEAFKSVFFDCGMEPAVQKVLREGLAQIEKTISQQSLNQEILQYIEAVIILGRFYSDNSIYPIKWDKAEHYYQQALHLQFTPALGMMGEVWYSEINDISNSIDELPYHLKNNCQKAQYYFEQGAAHDDLRSLQRLVPFYLKNQCTPKDEVLAMQYLEKLALLVENQADAYYLQLVIDDLYQMQYFSDTLKYATLLANKDYSPAMKSLAQTWLNPQNALAPNTDKALFWYRKYLDAFSKTALSDKLAQAYYDAAWDFSRAGLSEIADSYFYKSAKLGNENAQRILQQTQ